MRQTYRYSFLCFVLFWLCYASYLSSDFAAVGQSIPAKVSYKSKCYVYRHTTKHVHGIITLTFLRLYCMILEVDFVWKCCEHNKDVVNMDISSSDRKLKNSCSLVRTQLVVSMRITLEREAVIESQLYSGHYNKDTCDGCDIHCHFYSFTTECCSLLYFSVSLFETDSTNGINSLRPINAHIGQ